jgi:pyridoxine 5-phosphate synthase
VTTSAAGGAKLSVNVNKVATLRNSRGGHLPSVVDAVRVSIASGAPGITVHPRADARHITSDDVREIAAELEPLRGRIEYNIEGDPRPDLLALVREVRPDQCTLVPVRAGEITSQGGWPPDAPADELRRIVRELRDDGVRVSVFVDADPAPVKWAAALSANRIELYTEPFARAFEKGERFARESFERYAAAARLAHELGLGVNAGHDLDLQNLTLFRALPHLAEVSIGHALISHALFVGLDRAVRDYVNALRLNGATAARSERLATNDRK